MRNDHLRWTGIGCALLGAVLTALVVARWRPLIAYDERVSGDLHAHAVTHPGVTHLMRVLSDWVWDPWTMRALAVAACALLWWRGHRGRALRVAVVTLAASVLQQGLKVLVGRERPVWSDPVDSAQYAAYPSGHAMTATVVCGLLLWLLPRPGPGGWPVAWAVAAWVVAVVSVLGVGFTRVYLGVHWPSDVLAGWLLGVALVALATSVPVRERGCDPVER
ncbi:MULTISPECIES: phosphatase PAP2 family protein [Streptomyces]|uniref:phosphatase PAP2 family protein n=1 Tax=Streptomyces TaxID=1883 RepID=UPI0020794DAE|nr:MULTISPECIES: phosphatase PAP2 family protein [Streptomyces]MCM9077872.1 phosphatase PAP2 family protein [Streptomyces spororaveus]MCX5307649.1 phosphatase PAP2 family protein [Streptomyces sp. NBC_00160]